MQEIKIQEIRIRQIKIQEIKIRQRIGLQLNETMRT